MPKTAPNIVIIYYDDIGYGDLRCYFPDSVALSPHTDALAASGKRYTDAHSASAVCTPSRYSLVSGRYAWRTWLKRSVLDGYGPSLFAPGEWTLPKFLGKHGYKTAMIGKWHLGFGNEKSGFSAESPEFPKGTVSDWKQRHDNDPSSNGFDYSYVMSASLDFPPYMYIENGVQITAPTDHAEGYDEGGGMFKRPGAAVPGFDEYEAEPHFVDRVVAYLDARGVDADEKPFFLQYSSTGPHAPIVPKDAYLGKAPDRYTAFLQQLDDSVGRIVDALERNGLRDNTIVILSTDHGARKWGYEKVSGHQPNGHWRGEKSMLYEGGHRIPLIISWPAKVAPGVSDRLVVQTDLFATIADLISVALPENAGADSFSFADDLVPEIGKTGPLRTTAVHHGFVGTFALRSGPWKMILDDQSGGFDGTYPELAAGGVPEPGQDKWRLFNLESDPRETTDVRSQNPEVFSQMVAKFEEIYRSGRERRG